MYQISIQRRCSQQRYQSVLLTLSATRRFTKGCQQLPSRLPLQHHMVEHPSTK